MRTPALWVALATGALTSNGLGAATDRATDIGPLLQDSFIWLAAAPKGQQAYVAFRKRFELAEAPKAARLDLFADSRYVLWINGQYVERGPCRFDPKAPEYDSLELTPFFRPGSNVVAILVHHFHDGTSRTNWTSLNGRIMRHEPGLTARLDLSDSSGQHRVIRTDASWRGSSSTRFTPGPLDRWQNCWASLPDRIDARRDPEDWTLAGFADSTWEEAAPVSGKRWGPLRPRTIPRLRETEIGPLRLVERSGEQVTQPLGEILPITMKAGDDLILDAGEFVQAYSVLDFEAESGSELELEYAPSYFDTGRKPTGSFGRVNQYIARAGRQSYMSNDTFGFKYFIIRLKTGQVKLDRVRLVNRLYPFDVVGRFTCDDVILNTIWRNSVHTVRVCSEDAYVDCANRERTEWLADAYAVAYRVTRVALAGPGAGRQVRYSDPRLLANLLRHIGQSQQPDGRLKAHHPSDRWDIHGYIEDYACLWVHALREYYDHTGDAALVGELWPALAGQMQWFLDRRTTNGLVQAREFVYFSNPLIYKTCEGASLNAYFYRALRGAAHLAGVLGKTGRQNEYSIAADNLFRNFNERLWDPASQTYFGALLNGTSTPPTAHAAVISLHFGIVPAERRAQVVKWMLANYRKEGFSPYTHLFLLNEIYRVNSDDADREALALMRTRWAAMAKGETGTVWEGFGPSENGHESGAAPAYYLSAYVLGVRLDGPIPGKRLLIEPRLGDLKEASGVVVTELGPVPVSWKRTADGKRLEFRFEVPAGVTATISIPKLAEKSSLAIGDKTLVRPGGPPVADAALRGRYFVVKVGPGVHSGRVTSEP